MFFDVYLQLCNEKEISPTKAAIEMGIGRSTVSAWRNEGRVPSGSTLQKIADYFGVTVDYLLGNAQKESPAAEAGSGDVLDEVDVAFYGDYRELTEDEKNVIRDMVQVMRNRRKK